MKKLLAHTFATMSLAFAVPPGAGAAETDIRSTAATANTAWNQALNSGNAAALAALYAENATVSPGDGSTISGRAAIQKLFQGFVDNGVHNHTIDILDVGGDERVIHQVARWNANGAESNGSKPSFGGILVSVLEKNAEGRWLVRTHVWNMGQ